MERKLLCSWYGENIYEDSEKEKLVEIIKALADVVDKTREEHKRDMEFMSLSPHK